MVSASIVALAAASTLFHSASAHMIMKTPPPIGQPDNSPLLASGANFPCKNPSPGDAKFFAQGTVTNMAVGETQTLSFTGSAVHGGGSCQLAITKDPNPGPSTSWQVIQSYEGGCPGVNGPSEFQYKIPEGIQPGPYIMQWHWMSKLAGQPEYYQNCAKIQVTGGKTRRSDNETEIFQRDAAAFPELFVANLASINSCKGGPSYDVKYPNPGPNLVTAPGALLQPPTGTNCVPKGLTQGAAPASPSGSTGSGSGSSSAAGGSAPSAAPSTGAGSGSGSGAGAGAAPSAGAGSGSGSGSGAPSSAAGAAPSAGAGSGSGLGSGSGAAPSAAAPTAASTSAVATPISVPSSTPAAGAAPSAASGGSAPSTSGGAGSMTGPCTPEGQWNCIGGNSFQRCASGQWSAVTQLSGTQCTPGQSATITITKRGSNYLLPRNVALKHRRVFVA